MSDRIEQRFARIKTENRAALIPFIMGCDPDAKTTTALLDTLVSSGADLIELGMPTPWPMALSFRRQDCAHCAQAQRLRVFWTLSAVLEKPTQIPPSF